MDVASYISHALTKRCALRDQPSGIPTTHVCMHTLCFCRHACATEIAASHTARWFEAISSCCPGSLCHLRFSGRGRVAGCKCEMYIVRTWLAEAARGATPCPQDLAFLAAGASSPESSPPASKVRRAWARGRRKAILLQAVLGRSWLLQTLWWRTQGPASVSQRGTIEATSIENCEGQVGSSRGCGRVLPEAWGCGSGGSATLPFPRHVRVRRCNWSGLGRVTVAHRLSRVTGPRPTAQSPGGQSSTAIHWTCAAGRTVTIESTTRTSFFSAASKPFWIADSASGTSAWACAGGRTYSQHVRAIQGHACSPATHRFLHR